MKFVLPVVCFILLSFPGLYTAPMAAQTLPTDEAVAKKYERILGQYEFEIGGQKLIIAFLIREGGLWADSGDGRPAEIKPANRSNEEFTGEDSENGRFEVAFIKDEEGQYTKCHFVMKSQDVDATGKKIK